MGAAFDLSLIVTFIPKLLGHLGVTFEILIASICFGIVVGLLLAMIRYYNIPILKQFVIVYVSFIRGTPIIIQLFLVFYGLPEILNLIGIDIKRMDALIFVIITYSLSNAASFSEIFRGALIAVNKGQIEAAQSIGMTTWQSMRRIILPQAIAKSIPNFVSLMIGFLHATSIAFLISVVEITGLGKILASINLKFLEAYIAAGILYWLLTICIEWLGAIAERRVKNYVSS